MRRFGRHVAVDHVDLRVRAGELYGLLGPNGSGKTTTLRMLSGLLEPTEGTATVLGLDLLRTARVKSEIGYLPQRGALYEDLTVVEHLQFCARLHGVPREDRAKRIAQMIQFGDLAGRERQRIGRLCEADRRRLGLACVVVHAPRLVLLDEPTASVDPIARRGIWAAIRSLTGDGVTVVVTTKFMDEAELCDALGFLYQGRLVVQGALSSIKSRTFVRPIIEIEAADPRRAADWLDEWEAIEEVVRVGARLRAVAVDDETRAADVARFLERRGETVRWAHEVEPSVEDVFVSFVDRQRKGRLREELHALDAAAVAAR